MASPCSACAGIEPATFDTVAIFVDYQDLRKPFHEFRFAPVQARFIKLQVLSFHALASSNVGIVGAIQLYASDTTGSASPR